MSLITFHRTLIVTAILFCAGFAGWELQRYAGSGETGQLLVGAAFAVAAGLLIYYLLHLNDFLGRDSGR